MTRASALLASLLLGFACAETEPGPVESPRSASLGNPAASSSPLARGFDPAVVVPPAERWAELQILRVEDHQDFPLADKAKLGPNQGIALRVVAHRPGYFAVARLDPNGAIFLIVSPAYQRPLDPTRPLRIPEVTGSFMPLAGYAGRERFALLVSGQPFDVTTTQLLLEEAARLVPPSPPRPRPDFSRSRPQPQLPRQPAVPPTVAVEDDPAEDARGPDSRRADWTTSLPPYVESQPSRSAVTVVQVRRRP